MPAFTTRLLAAGFLLVHLALGLWQMTHTAPTFDEGFYIARGWAWWQTGTLMTLGHPPLASQIAGAAALLEPNLPHPNQLPGWLPPRADAFSNALLWQAAPNPERLIFMARLPFLLLSLLLGAATFHWASQRFGAQAGLLALGLHALSPNLLGNAPLAATDLLVATFFVLSLLTYQRALQKPISTRIALAGLCLGLAQASKFSALLIGPLLAALTLWHARQHLAAATRVALGTILIGLLALWGLEGFSLHPWPLGAYLADLQHFLTLAEGGHFAYLFGQLSATGWWYYHLVVLAVKTPLIVLVLLGVSLMAARRDSAPHHRRTDAILLGSSAFFLGMSLLTTLNVGYRYLLPILPLLHIYAAGTLRWRAIRRPLLVSSLLLAAMPLASVAPDFLTYFNLTVGGPRNGWRVLVDSNLDWGQGLPAVADTLGDQPIYLSYFGQADPAHYGLNVSPIPGWPPPNPEPDFTPGFPAPGRYVISASNLVGVQLYDPNAFGYFRHRTPQQVINFSYFVYDVPERPAGQWFNQCPRLLTTRQMFDLTGYVGPLHTVFDCQTALLLGPGAGWLLLPESDPPPVPLPPPDFLWQRADGSLYYRLYYLPANWQPDLLPLAPQTFGQALTLIGAAVEPTPTHLNVTAAWRIEQPLPPPVSIFAHLVGPDGAFIEAGDTLGADPATWQAGGLLIQQHTISLPAEWPLSSYTVYLGLYRLDTGERYLTESGADAVLLGPFVP